MCESFQLAHLPKVKGVKGVEASCSLIMYHPEQFPGSSHSIPFPPTLAVLKLHQKRFHDLLVSVHSVLRTTRLLCHMKRMKMIPSLKKAVTSHDDGGVRGELQTLLWERFSSKKCDSVIKGTKPTVTDCTRRSNPSSDSAATSTKETSGRELHISAEH